MAILKDHSPICVWPDNTWCWGDELEGYLASGKSDDYAIHQMDDALTDEEVEQYVIHLK